jgi:hypothetical protein
MFISKISISFFSLCFSLGILLVAMLGCRSPNQSNAPSWTKVKILSNKEDHPSKIVTDGDAVYYITGGTVASMNEGTNNIKRISLKDGTVSVLVKGGKIIPDEMLAVDDKYLYWSDGGNIMRVPKGGGDSEKIIPNAPKPDEVVMDDENIYWVIWGGEGSPPSPLMVAPKAGGAPKELTPRYSGTSGISIDRDYVYWMTGDGIKKISKKGGEVIDVYRNTSKSPSLGLLQDAANFYFSQMNNRGKSALMKLNKKSGEATQLAGSINHVMDFTADSENIYYFDNVPGQGSFGPVALMKVSKAGGNPVELDQGTGGWIRYLAVDAKQVYFTDISKVNAIAK